MDDAMSWLGTALERGERAQVVASLAQAVRRAPWDGALVHAFFLVCWHGVRSVAEPRAALPTAGELWRWVIAAWAVLQGSAGFWTGWQARAAARCRSGDSFPDAEGCRKLLAEKLRPVLETGFDETDEPGELRLLLARELRAAELVSAAGGWPLPGEVERRLVCGPLMVDFLGGAPAFGEFVRGAAQPRSPAVVRRQLSRLAGAAAEPRHGAQLGVEAKKLLLRHGSGLGRAQVLLELGRPREALLDLDDLRCPRCREAGGRRRPAGGWQPRVCEQSCPSFDGLHPAFAGIAEKAELLRREGRELAAEAQIELAVGLLRSDEGDAGAAMACWREAIRLSGSAQTASTLEQRLVETVLGRVAVLLRAKNDKAAIALLEGALEIAGGDLAEQLRGRLSELLARYGVEAGNARTPRWREAVNHLRRAVCLNPYAPHPAEQLNVALRAWAAERAGKEPVAAALLLEEALAHFERMRVNFPDLAEIEEQQRQIRQDLQDLGGRSRTQGRQEKR